MPHPQFQIVRNLPFCLRYFNAIRRHQSGRVSLETIDAALHDLYPHAHYPGDKYPDYWFQLDRFARTDAIRCIFIYRDPRDVARSMVENTRTIWRQWYPDEVRSPKSIAQRWVKMMERVQHQADKVFVIRYEDFVTNPQPILNRLGEWLEIDPQLFDATQIHAESIGRHRAGGLTDMELSEMIEVAGPLMQNYGYAI